MARDHKPLLLVGWLWGVGVVLSVVVRGAFLGGGRHADFALFYETIERARLGLPLYGPLTTAGREWLAGPNYNPPHFYLLVMPFASLPFAGAFIAWTLAGLMAGGYAGIRIARTLDLHWSRDGLLLIGGLVLANATLASTVLAGQLSLIVALPACFAWVAAREGRWTRAGIWIGLAASVKPFLLIVALYLLLKRRWRAIAAMGAAGLSAVLLGVVAFGPDAFRGWLGILGSPRMDQHFHNASFAGAMARVFGSQGLAVASAIAGLGLILTVAAAARSKDVDRSWLLLMAGALLWTPLGWIYYGWFLMPPVIGLAVRRGADPFIWFWALLWLWPPYVPRLGAGHFLGELTLGSIYFWGLLMLWMGALRDTSACEPIRPASSRPKSPCPTNSTASVSDGRKHQASSSSVVSICRAGAVSSKTIAPQSNQAPSKLRQRPVELLECPTSGLLELRKLPIDGGPASLWLPNRMQHALKSGSPLSQGRRQATALRFVTHRNCCTDAGTVRTATRRCYPQRQHDD